jgi:hypothetical protein
MSMGVLSGIFMAIEINGLEKIRFTVLQRCREMPDVPHARLRFRDPTALCITNFYVLAIRAHVSVFFFASS